MVDRRIGVASLFDERSAAYQFTARMRPGCIMGSADGGWSTESIVPD
jgi:hypothetical protein